MRFSITKLSDRGFARRPRGLFGYESLYGTDSAHFYIEQSGLG